MSNQVVQSLIFRLPGNLLQPAGFG